MVKNIIKSFLPKLMGFRLMALYKLKPQKAIHKAFLLFCTPRRGFVKPHQKDYLKAHQSESIQYKKIKIQTYHWPGKGPKILLLHGWDSHSFRWKELVKKLSALDYDVMACDAPAHGYSEGNILNVPIYDEVTQLMIDKFDPSVLIGHSLGAMTCIYNQHKQKQTNINKMILLGSPSSMVRVMKGFQQILGLGDNFMEVTEDYFESRYGYRFKDFSISSFAQDVNIPSLVIHDKYDKIVPYKEGIAIDNALTNSNLIITEGAGHSLNTDSIDNEIIKFLKH